MPPRNEHDAVVVGSGPNGLAAAITLARAGHSVLVFEAKETAGGGMRTAELTLPGFRHDICSAIHPMGVASPFMRTLSLEQYGLEWIQPPSPLAHPLDGGEAVFLERSTQATGEGLEEDATTWRELMDPLVANWEAILADILGPLPLPPRHPLLLMRFGLQAVRSVMGLAKGRFRGRRARGLFGGLGAHSILSLEEPISAAFGLVLGLLGQAVGWPIPRCGSQSIADAMSACLGELGGEIITAHPIRSLADLPPARVTLFDVTPRQLLEIAGEQLPSRYRCQLQRYRYGPAAFKVDWALHEPIPWKAGEIRRAGTVHVGGDLEEVFESEAAIWRGENPEKPFVILAQQSLHDPTRAPQGKHTAWAYCHVPNGSPVDMTERIEAQVERFAPGFRDCILERHVLSPRQMEAYNPNYVGGDFNGGVQDLGQLFTRPIRSLKPYAIPLKGMYLCSSSTPPGGAVHGMCGYHAARLALEELDRAI